MVQGIFIADQRSCGLWRHLDSVPQDTPIREIVDHCRVWESHSEQSPGTDMYWGHTGVASDSRESTLVMKDSLRVEPVSVASVVQSDPMGAQEVGSVRNQDASLGILSSLIARLIRAAQEDNPAEMKVPLDAGTRGPPVAPFPGTSAQSPVSEAEPVMVCFSCGRPGYGVNQCSRVDTSFPFLPPGWSVAVQDGQDRAVWRGGFSRETRDGLGGRVSLPDHR